MTMQEQQAWMRVLPQAMVPSAERAASDLSLHLMATWPSESSPGDFVSYELVPSEDEIDSWIILSINERLGVDLAGDPGGYDNAEAGFKAFAELVHERSQTLGPPSYSLAKGDGGYDSAEEDDYYDDYDFDDEDDDDDEGKPIFNSRQEYLTALSAAATELEHEHNIQVDTSGSGTSIYVSKWDYDDDALEGDPRDMDPLGLLYPVTTVFEKYGLGKVASYGFDYEPWEQMKWKPQYAGGDTHELIGNPYPGAESDTSLLKVLDLVKPKDDDYFEADSQALLTNDEIESIRNSLRKPEDTGAGQQLDYRTFKHHGTPKEPNYAPRRGRGFREQRRR